MEKNGVFFPKHSTNQPSKTHPTTHPFHSSVQKMASIGHRFMQPFQQYKQDHPIPRKARHPDPLEVTPHIKMRQPPYDFSSRVGDLEEASDSSSGPSSRWEPLSGRERSASSTPIHGRSPFVSAPHPPTQERNHHQHYFLERPLHPFFLSFSFPFLSCLCGIASHSFTLDSLSSHPTAGSFPVPRG